VSIKGYMFEDERADLPFSLEECLSSCPCPFLPS
jgi:hypothetical protein